MRHSVDNLCYQIIEGEICLEPLRVLARREIAWQEARVVFFVLGASHAISININGRCVTELLTCAPLAASGRVLASSAVCDIVKLHVGSPGLQCRTLLHPFSLDEGDRLIGNYAPDSALAAAYPPHAEGQSPVTRIGWHVAVSGLIVETVHTYPEEGRGVRSRTVFRLNSPASHTTPDTAIAATKEAQT